MYSNNNLKTKENLFSMIRARQYTESDAICWLFNSEFGKEASGLKLALGECEKLCWLDDHSTAIVAHQTNGLNEVAVVKLVVDAEGADLIDVTQGNSYKIDADGTEELKNQFIGTWEHTCGEEFCAYRCQKCGGFSIVKTATCSHCGSKMKI